MTVRPEPLQSKVAMRCNLLQIDGLKIYTKLA